MTAAGRNGVIWSVHLLLVIDKERGYAGITLIFRKQKDLI